MQTESATNILIQCQNRDLSGTGELTIEKFKEALVTTYPDLGESEVKHTLRDIDVVNGKIRYQEAITKHKL